MMMLAFWIGTPEAASITYPLIFEIVDEIFSSQKDGETKDIIKSNKMSKQNLQ